MNLRLITARTAVAGVTTALAAGALVGVSTTAANAETASSTYTCKAPADAYISDFAITVSGGLPVPEFFAGAPVPPGLVNVSVSSTLTPEQAAALGSFGITGAHSDDFTLGFGSATVPLPVDGDFDSTTTPGTTVWTATGANKAFTTPNPGTPDIVLPSAFTMTTENASGDFLPLACTIQADTTPAVLVNDFPLARQLSATVAKARNGKMPAVVVTVTSKSWGPTVATGNVVVKEGKKVIGKGKLAKKGKAVISLSKKLKAGKHKVTVTYAGTKSLKGSAVKVTVTKKK